MNINRKARYCEPMKEQFPVPKFRNKQTSSSYNCSSQCCTDGIPFTWDHGTVQTFRKLFFYDSLCVPAMLTWLLCGAVFRFEH